MTHPLPLEDFLDESITFRDGTLHGILECQFFANFVFECRVSVYGHLHVPRRRQLFAGGVKSEFKST
jgi:hypothetical protein